METVTERWEKEFQAVADSINKNDKLLKEEKVAKIASGGAQMIHRAAGLLSTFELRLKGNGASWMNSYLYGTLSLFIL